MFPNHANYTVKNSISSGIKVSITSKYSTSRTPNGTKKPLQELPPGSSIGRLMFCEIILCFICINCIRKLFKFQHCLLMNFTQDITLHGFTFGLVIKILLRLHTSLQNPFIFAFWLNSSAFFASIHACFTAKLDTFRHYIFIN